MALSRTALFGAALAALAAVLAGCSTRTNVSATGNSSALSTHVYIPAQEVWFNASANAGPSIRTASRSHANSVYQLSARSSSTS